MTKVFLRAFIIVGILLPVCGLLADNTAPILVTVIGGGGGAGANGAGGGAGGITRTTTTLELGRPYSVVIGKEGANGINGAAGSPGGASSFAGIEAEGGGGGGGTGLLWTFVQKALVITLLLIATLVILAITAYVGHRVLSIRGKGNVLEKIKYIAKILIELVEKLNKVLKPITKFFAAITSIATAVGILYRMFKYAGVIP